MNNLPGNRPILYNPALHKEVGSSYQSLRSVGLSALSRHPPMRPTGIMRHRPRPTEHEEVSQPVVMTDSRTDNLITNFVVGNGLPFEVVNSESFKDLMLALNPRMVLPTPKVVESCSEKLGNPGKPIVNYHKTTGPLSVTLQVTNVNQKHYLAFSIHYFNEARNRRDVIYLRELMLSRLDETCLLTTLRRAVSAYNYANVKFTNLVVPDQEVYELLKDNEIVKRSYICFYNYMSTFVRKILDIDLFAQGIQQLRNFVTSVTENPDDYSKFRRLQLTKNAELDLPALDNNVWESTAVFLTRCLILNETFVEFVDRCRITNYITQDMFLTLVGLHRLLQRCVKYSRNLSTYTSSVSQLMPTIFGLHNFVQDCDLGAPSALIRNAFTAVFTPLTTAPLSDRLEIATLLDPRFAYRENVFGTQQWTRIEKKLVNDFADYLRVQNSERNFTVDIGLMCREEKVRLIQQELKSYRQIILCQRPEEYHNPFTWWIRNSAELDYLSVLAREYLACPAVAIDSDFHFAPGGKFSHVCKNYSHQLVENILNSAGVHQKFRGRGASVDFIQPRQIEHLNSIAIRRQKELLSRRIVPFDVKNKIHEIKHSDALGRLLRNQGTPECEEKPDIAQIVVNKSSATTKRRTPAITVEEEEQEEEDIKPDIRLLSGGTNLQETKANTGLELNTSVTISSAHEIDSVSPLPSERTQLPSSPQPSTSNAEKKPDEILLNEIKQEIKEEPLDEDDIQEQPVTITKPPTIAGKKVVMSANKPAGVINTGAGGKVVYLKSTTATFPSKTAVIFPPNRPNPQMIQRANFVQKFAQKQNFVQKFVVKKPESTSQRSHQQLISPSWAAGIKITLEEGKPAGMNFDSPCTSDMIDYDEDDLDNSSSYGAVMDRMEGNRFYIQRPRKPCNRRCAVCSSMEEHEHLKNVTIDSEKLMIVLGATYRREMSILEGAKCLAKTTKTYMCRVHFTEACDEIFKMLRVKTPDEIATCSVDLINNALITVNQLRQRQMAVPDLRKCLIHFATKYYDGPVTVKTEKPNDLDDQQVGGERADDSDILPKTCRQPRKQVLEEDQHDSTVKLIEQEDFKLPQVKPVDDSTSTGFEQPEFCCYCSEHNSRNDMVRVPKSEERVVRWLHALGHEFGKRLKPECDNYICRSHFSSEAFSSRGRLLKGMLPNVKPDKVEVTYKIQGTNFLKLGEERSGREKDARFDLEHGKDYGSDDESEQSEQAPDETGEEELHGTSEPVHFARSTTSPEVAHSTMENTTSRPSTTPERNPEGVKRSGSSDTDSSVPSKKKKVIPPPSRSSARLSKKF